MTSLTNLDNFMLFGEAMDSKYACFVFWGESAGSRLFSIAFILEWLRHLHPTTHRGAVLKDGAEIP